MLCCNRHPMARRTMEMQKGARMPVKPASGLVYERMCTQMISVF